MILHSRVISRDQLLKCNSTDSISSTGSTGKIKATEALFSEREVVKKIEDLIAMEILQKAWEAMVTRATCLPRKIGMKTLKRQSVREWTEVKSYVEVEVPK